MTSSVLVFGWGNPSRGDDALGPMFVERIEALNIPGVECLTDFQLQVEHALDLQGRSRILFVDASIDTPTPFALTRIGPAQDATFASHAMSPQAVLKVYQDLQGQAPPPAWLLAIRAEHFQLGESLSPTANGNLQAALAWADGWLRKAPGDAPG